MVEEREVQKLVEDLKAKYVITPVDKLTGDAAIL